MMVFPSTIFSIKMHGSTTPIYLSLDVASVDSKYSLEISTEPTFCSQKFLQEIM